MSSCVMIVSEFSNRIETIFSYQTPCWSLYCFKKKKEKKAAKKYKYWLLLSKQQLRNKWAWKSQNIKQQRASNEK